MHIRGKLVERLAQYYKLKDFHTVWISIFALYLNFRYGFYESMLLDYGLLLVVFILAQGTYFWMIKYKHAGNKFDLGAKSIELFTRFKYINIFFIILYPFFIGYLHLYDLLAIQENRSWAFFSYAFGIAEYINYYHFQLMYDNNNDWNYLRKYKRLKISHLNKMIS